MAQAPRRSDQARVDLYELSDPERLAAVASDTFPIPPSVRARTGGRLVLPSGRVRAGESP